MGKVIKADFEGAGLKIAERRAIALVNHLIQHGPLTVEELQKERERLARIMPSPEDEGQ